MIVDGDDLNQHHVADPADVVDVADVAAGHFADVDQTVFAGEDFNERAEFLDRGDAAFVDRADFNPFRHRLNTVAAGFRARGLGAGDRNDAGVFNVDFSAGVFLQLPNRFAAGADDQADLLGIDLNLDQTRRVRRDFLARPLDGAKHGPQNLQPCLVGLVESLADDLLGDPLVLEIQLDSGDASLGAGDLEIHVAEVIFVADDVGQ